MKKVVAHLLLAGVFAMGCGGDGGTGGKAVKPEVVGGGKDKGPPMDPPKDKGGAK